MKKVLIAIVCVVLAVSMAGCAPSQQSAGESTTGSVGAEASEGDIVQGTPEISIEDYKSLISDSQTNIEKAVVVLSNMGKYEYNFIDAREGLSKMPFDPETVVESAKEWLEENDVDFSEIEAIQKTIDDEYKEIIAIDISGSEAEKIKELYDELYDGYRELSRVVVSPPTNADEFADVFNGSIDTIQGCNEKISLLVSD